MKGGSYKYPVGYKNTYIEVLSVEKNHFVVHCSLCGSEGTLNRQAILSKLLACDKCRKEYFAKKLGFENYKEAKKKLGCEFAFYQSESGCRYGSF